MILTNNVNGHVGKTIAAAGSFSSQRSIADGRFDECARGARRQVERSDTSPQLQMRVARRRQLINSDVAY